MITFKQFILEDDKYVSSTTRIESPKEFIARIKRDCAPFISECLPLMKDERFLFRGTHTAYGDIMLFGKPRQNRRPRDTQPEFHDMLDAYFKDEFGFPYRSSGLFCSAAKEETHGYGDTYIVFPVGKVRACWSDEISDAFFHLFNDVDNHIRMLIRNYKMSEDDIKKVLTKYNLYYPKLDDNWADDSSDWHEYGTFKYAFYERRRVDVPQELPFTANQLRDNLNKYFTEFIFPKCGYKETSVSEAMTESGGSEIMLDCSEFYLLKYADYYKELDSKLPWESRLDFLKIIG